MYPNLSCPPRCHMSLTERSVNLDHSIVSDGNSLCEPCLLTKASVPMWILASWGLKIPLNQHCCQSLRLFVALFPWSNWTTKKNIWKLGHYYSFIPFILNTTVYSNIIPNSQKLEAAQLSSSRMDKQKFYPRMGKIATCICILKY